MKFDDLTPEQKAKASACKTPQELINLAMEEAADYGIQRVAVLVEPKRAKKGVSPFGSFFG